MISTRRRRPSHWGHRWVLLLLMGVFGCSASQSQEEDLEVNPDEQYNEDLNDDELDQQANENQGNQQYANDQYGDNQYGNDQYGDDQYADYEQQGEGQQGYDQQGYGAQNGQVDQSQAFGTLNDQGYQNVPVQDQTQTENILAGNGYEPAEVGTEMGEPMAPEEDLAAALSELKWVGYDYQKEAATLRVEMLTSGTPKFDIFQERNLADQPELVVRFFETSLRSKIRRDIDASEFRSPVSYIRMRRNSADSTVDVIMTLRNEVKPRLYAKEGNVLLTYAVPQTYLGEPAVEGDPVATAQLLPDVDIMPDIGEGSDLPISTAYVPDPAAATFADAPEDGGEVVDVEDVAENATDYGQANGLPTDFDNGQGQYQNAANQYSNGQYNNGQYDQGNYNGGQYNNGQYNQGYQGQQGNYNQQYDNQGQQGQDYDQQYQDNQFENDVDELNNFDDGEGEAEQDDEKFEVRAYPKTQTFFGIAQDQYQENYQENYNQQYDQQQGDGNEGQQNDQYQQGLNDNQGNYNQGQYNQDPSEAGYQGNQYNQNFQGTNQQNFGQQQNTGQDVGYQQQEQGFGNGQGYDDQQVQEVGLDDGEGNPIESDYDQAPIAEETQGEDLFGGDVPGSESEGPPAEYTGKPIKLEFRNAPLSEVIRALAAESNMNLVFPPSFSNRRMDLSLKDVPWDEALKVVLDLNSLGMVRQGNVIIIDSLANITRQRQLLRSAQDSAARLVDTKVLILRLSYAKADTVKRLIESMLAQADASAGPSRVKIDIDARTNSVIVEAIPTDLAKVKSLVERLDTQTPQVEIGSRLIEVTKSVNNFLGIRWGNGYNYDPGRGLGAGSLVFPNSLTSRFVIDPGVGTEDQPGRSSTGSANFTFGALNNSVNLDLRLLFEEQKNNIEILQSNKLVVQDNQPASISAGRTDMFRRVANVAVSDSTGQPVGGLTQGLDKVEHHLKLDVTPHVTADGMVEMNLKIASNSATAPEGTAVSAQNSRSLNTTLLKKSGETVVIGGIHTNEKTEQRSGIPVLSNIPIIGALFRSKSTEDSQKELLIMVTPRIVNGALLAPSETFDSDGGFENQYEAASDSGGGGYNQQFDSQNVGALQNQQNYGNQQGYENQQGNQQGYGDQQGYENQQGYDDQQGYNQQNGGQQQAGYDQQGGNSYQNEQGYQQQGQNYQNQGQGNQAQYQNQQYENL